MKKVRKFRCISTKENLQKYWAVYFGIDTVVDLISEYDYFYEVSDPDGYRYTWYVDKECFEEVFDEE